jgi:hypothetical protein
VYVKLIQDYLKTHRALRWPYEPRGSEGELNGTVLTNRIGR